jgi:hypothetical protein
MTKIKYAKSVQAFVGRYETTRKYIKRILTFRAKALQTKGLRSKRRNYPYIFSGGFIPTNERLFILLALPTLTKTVQDYTKTMRSRLSKNIEMHGIAFSQTPKLKHFSGTMLMDSLSP